MRFGLLILVFGAVACDGGVEGLSDEQMQLDPETITQEELERSFPGGATCGDAVCGVGQYCCNASCSGCAPFGGSCTQQVCNSAF